MKRGLVGSIERFALHDGPGIRTTVFLKGCPLRCIWCHNPEFRSFRPEVAFYPGRCIGCGDCVAACPEGAVGLEREDRIDRSRCRGCGICADACPAKALRHIGQVRDVDSVLQVVLRDRLFYEASGGGVTLSGGEPTAQMGFCGALLERLQGEGLHTAMETSGLFSWKRFRRMSPHLDLILYDVKLADSREHRRMTGVGNSPILANLERLLNERPDDVVVRIPLIPGCTTSKGNMACLSDRLRKMGARRYSLLPYNPHGYSKSSNIGLKPDPILSTDSMGAEEPERWKKYFEWCEAIDP